jgi:hypothetical protein
MFCTLFFTLRNLLNFLSSSPIITTWEKYDRSTQNTTQKLFKTIKKFVHDLLFLLFCLVEPRSTRLFLISPRANKIDFGFRLRIHSAFFHNSIRNSLIRYFEMIVQSRRMFIFFYSFGLATVHCQFLKTVDTKRVIGQVSFTSGVFQKVCT